MQTSRRPLRGDPDRSRLRRRRKPMPRAGGQRGEPVVRLDWLSPGVHVTCYMPPFGELNRRIIQHGWLFVETRLNGIGYALQ
jgi:hypothetical protein